MPLRAGRNAVSVASSPIATVIGATGIIGDDNRNGTVDAADYVVRRKYYGSQYGHNTWRANFGQTAAVALLLPAMPEPASALLPILGAAAGAWMQRRVASQLPSTS